MNSADKAAFQVLIAALLVFSFSFGGLIYFVIDSQHYNCSEGEK